MSKDNNTQPEEVKIEEPVTEPAEQEEEVQPEEAEETLADIVPDEEPEEEKPKPKPETVPIDVYLQLKKELKEMKKSRTSSEPTDSSIEEIANEFDVDPAFAKKLAGAIEQSSVSKFEERYLAEKKQAELKEKVAQGEQKLDKAIESALESSPFYKDVVNIDIIKNLARTTTDKTMTVSKLIESVYGKAVGGKKTMESSAPSSGERGESKVDFSMAGDPAVYAQIKADPKLRKEYNEYLVKNLNI
jgi:hypothetical protein